MLNTKYTSSLAYSPYSLSSASFRMIASTEKSSVFFLYLMTTFDFRSLSIQSNHLNFGLPCFLLSSGFPRNTSLTVLPSDILTRWPAHSNLLTSYRRYLQRRPGRFAGSSEFKGYAGKATQTREVEASWNVMSHAQKPVFAFRRNGRVHLNRQGRQFSRLLAAEVCASAVVMLDTPCSEVV